MISNPCDYDVPGLRLSLSSKHVLSEKVGSLVQHKYEMELLRQKLIFNPLKVYAARWFLVHCTAHSSQILVSGDIGTTMELLRQKLIF